MANSMAEFNKKVIDEFPIQRRQWSPANLPAHQ